MILERTLSQNFEFLNSALLTELCNGELKKLFFEGKIQNFGNKCPPKKVGAKILKSVK